MLAALVVLVASVAIVPGEARAATLTFAPAADATVSSTQPTRNLGRASTLTARQASTGTSRAYLRFTISGVTGAVAAARLRLNVTDTSPEGGTVRTADAGWVESSITWANAPPMAEPTLGVVGAATAKGWRDVALDPSTVPTSGTLSVAISSESADQVAYGSRESTRAPQLVLELAQAPSPPSSATTTAQPTPTPTPAAGSPVPSSAPTGLTTPEPSLIPTPSPADPSPPAEAPMPIPSATTDPALTPGPTPTPEPTPAAHIDVGLSRSLLISNGELLARPTSGAAWLSLQKDALGVWPAMDISNQDGKHARFVLAGALYAARTGDTGTAGRVVATLRALPTTPWSTNMLAFARQLSGYVIAADLIGFREPAFVAWLADARTRLIEGHSRWTSLQFTAGNTAGNWGTWALASLTAVDIYLGDASGIARDWAIYSGYGIPFATGWTQGPFVKTAAWDPAWSSIAADGTTKLPIAIDLNGALVEDASRSAGSDLDATGAMYVYESVRAVTTTTLLFRSAGFDVAGVTDGQLRRLVEWLRATPYADSIDGTLWGFGGGLAPWTRFGLNHLLDAQNPVNAPTNTDRHLGYTDWLWPA